MHARKKRSYFRQKRGVTPSLVHDAKYKHGILHSTYHIMHVGQRDDLLVHYSFT